MENIADRADLLFRVPFLFFVDLVLSKRVNFAFDYGRKYKNWINEICPTCYQPTDDHVALLLAIGLIICILTSILYIKPALIILLSTTAVLLAIAASNAFGVILHLATSPCHESRQTIHLLSRYYFTFSLTLAMVIFALFQICMLPRFNRSLVLKSFLASFLVVLVSRVTYAPVRLLVYGDISNSHLLQPSDGYCPIWVNSRLSSDQLKTITQNTILTDVFAFSAQCNVVAPSACSGNLSTGDLYYCKDQQVQCPVNSISLFTNINSSTNSIYELPNGPHLLINILPYLIFFAYLIIISSSLTTNKLLCIDFVEAINSELQYYNGFGLVHFLTFHWNRLKVHLLLASVWLFKTTLIVAFGAYFWPITHSSSSTSSEDTNFTFVQDYLNSSALIGQTLESPDQGFVDKFLTLHHLLNNRFLVGLLVHGSETWLVVFGSAALYGSIAGFFVRGIVILLDPSGDRIGELMAAAPNNAVEPYDWNAIEDPAVARDQNDSIAVEMLEGTEYNCAIVFLFLAFQYDLPSLPLAQRISLSIYGVIVVAISCIQPIQVMLKSLLLHLRAPGHGGVSWAIHVRLLSFCVLLFAASFGILTFIPRILIDRTVQPSPGQLDTTESSSQNYSVLSQLGAVFTTLSARQFRIVLYGYQLILSLTVTFIEYCVYQKALRHPDWTGFRKVLFWTKIISSVLDYLISLLSFLIVCWLAIYDSVGICRLFIICCYFYFILYPSAYQAFLWTRWRLLSSKRIQQFVSPTNDDLAAYDDKCAICYSEMTPDDSKATRCGHFYHTDCLSMWMRRQHFCPICHADLLSTNVVDRRQKTTASS